MDFISLFRKSKYVFAKKTNDYSEIPLRPNRMGVYKVFTTVSLSARVADAIGDVFPELYIKRVDIHKGYIYMKVKQGVGIDWIETAVRTILFKEEIS